MILFLFAAIGCVHGVYGFFLRTFGDRRRITNLANYRGQNIDGISTAIVFPIYNENVVRVYEGLRATYESLAQTGQLDRFDFFILSDSTDPDKWVEEERRWYDLIRELDALGKIYYRRRLVNEARKSGNVRDFLNTWGRRYRYFICCDADSVMRGETLVDLVKLMEAHPTAGLIQTVPALVNAESLFGRIQQFANRLYAPVFIAGLNYWALDLGNYWGHNAIIRTEPFMQCCDLPQLPGRKPFGGQILSHDFVEAALLLRENWEVWFAYDLEGSYEEAPQALDRKCPARTALVPGQFAAQLVLFAKGLRGVSRLHLMLGIFGYLAGPLWLAFLLMFNWIYWYQKYTGLSNIPVPAFNPYLSGLSGTAHALLIFVICMVVIMLPKLLALIDLARDWPRRKAFGGLARATAGVVGETIFSTLHAPVAHALAHAVRDHQPARHQRRLGRAKTRRRRHRLALRRATALGPHTHRRRLGRVHVAAGSDLVLVVHARAGRHGVVHSLERADQPPQPGRARPAAGTFSDAGRNQTAAGTGFAPRAVENSRTDRRPHAAAPARRTGRGDS